jgi:hypothetical protein
MEVAVSQNPFPPSTQHPTPTHFIQCANPSCYTILDPSFPDTKFCIECQTRAQRRSKHTSDLDRTKKKTAPRALVADPARSVAEIQAEIRDIQVSFFVGAGLVFFFCCFGDGCLYGGCNTVCSIVSIDQITSPTQKTI